MLMNPPNPKTGFRPMEFLSWKDMGLQGFVHILTWDERCDLRLWNRSCSLVLVLLHLCANLPSLWWCFLKYWSSCHCNNILHMWLTFINSWLQITLIILSNIDGPFQSADVFWGKTLRLPEDRRWQEKRCFIYFKKFYLCFQRADLPYTLHTRDFNVNSYLNF